MVIQISNKLILEYALPLSVNHYLSHRAYMVGKKPQVSVYVTSDAKKYKKAFIEYIKEEIKKQSFVIKLDKYQFTHVDVTWYFPRIDMDSNNLWKLSLDCLTDAGVWVDDNTTMERCKRIYYDNKNPRMIMEVYYSDYIGIFNDQFYLEYFISKCVHCTRYKNGKCSILSKAKQGRIQEEINDYACSKYKNK